MTNEIAEDLPEVHLADVKQELEPVKGMSVWARMRLSYRDMRGATRTLIEENPSEARLLFFVLLSDVIFFLSFGVRLIVSPSAVVEQALPVPAQLGVLLIGALFLRTATMYIFAGLVCLTGRAFGGRGGVKAVRAAVFWASLVSAPVGVLGAMISAGFAHLEPSMPILGNALFAWPPVLIGILAFVVFLAAGTAEAHRFTKTTPVLAVYAVITLVLLLAALLFGADLMAALGLSQ
ncbi:MAG: YIP1 family protein [Pseudomonadota bacterium]